MEKSKKLSFSVQSSDKSNKVLSLALLLRNPKRKVSVAEQKKMLHEGKYFLEVDCATWEASLQRPVKSFIECCKSLSKNSFPRKVCHVLVWKFPSLTRARYIEQQYKQKFYTKKKRRKNNMRLCFALTGCRRAYIYEL